MIKIKKKLFLKNVADTLNAMKALADVITHLRLLMITLLMVWL
jgi:hypothetical protein